VDVDEVWRHTHEQRRALAALLRDLSDDEWAVPSLCEGWTVRDVAAHVMRSVTVTPVETAGALVRFRGRFNALVAEDARQAARRPVAELLPRNPGTGTRAGGTTGGHHGRLDRHWVWPTQRDGDVLAVDKDIQQRVHHRRAERVAA
jgi:hypothetical protein